jgi:hypothetical protein
VAFDAAHAGHRDVHQHDVGHRRRVAATASATIHETIRNALDTVGSASAADRPVWVDGVTIG